jgi:hypothetical protein
MKRGFGLVFLFFRGMIAFLSFNIFSTVQTHKIEPPSTPRFQGFLGDLGALGGKKSKMYGRELISKVSSVSDMVESHREQARDMIVVQRVKDLPARFPRTDEAHLS